MKAIPFIQRALSVTVMGCVVNDIHNLVVASNDISVQGDALFSVEVAYNSQRWLYLDLYSADFPLQPVRCRMLL